MCNLTLISCVKEIRYFYLHNNPIKKLKEPLAKQAAL